VLFSALLSRSSAAVTFRESPPRSRSEASGMSRRPTPRASASYGSRRPSWTAFGPCASPGESYSDVILRLVQLEAGQRPPSGPCGALSRRRLPLPHDRHELLYRVERSLKNKDFLLNGGEFALSLSNKSAKSRMGSADSSGILRARLMRSGSR